MRRLCVIGLAPMHVALMDKGGVTAVDFNVGKTDRSGIKVTGKRKKVLEILPELESIIDFSIEDNTFRAHIDCFISFFNQVLVLIE